LFEFAGTSQKRTESHSRRPKRITAIHFVKELNRNQ
jgi:hypothetical protein